MKNCEPLVPGPAFFLQILLVRCVALHGASLVWSVGWTYRHGQQTGLVVLQVEVLVGKGLGAVDAGAAAAVAIQKVATLAHEVGYLFCYLSEEIMVEFGKGEVLLSCGTWSSCTLEVCPSSSWTRRYRTGESSRPSWELHR